MGAGAACARAAPRHRRGRAHTPTARLIGRARAAAGWLAAAAALAGLAAAAPALAADGIEPPRLPHSGLELGVGPYRPALSSEADIVRARQIVYDNGRGWLARHPVQVGILYARYLSRRAGLFGPYLRAAYWQQSATSRLCGDPADPVPCTAATLPDSVPGNDTARLSAVPVGVGALWRIDQLRRTHDLPLSFAVKAGVDYHFWWAQIGDSLERLPNAGHDKARGGTWGVSGAVQVALSLESLHRRSPAYGSRQAKPPTYLYGEYRVVYAPGLLQRGTRLDFTDVQSFAVGLALDLP